MPKSKLPRPTDAELSILQVLWDKGPCTVRQVLEELAEETGYTTVLKFLQIMTEKGLVTRDEANRTHIYHPAQPAELTQRQLISDLANRAFGGSATKLVVRALSTKKASPSELAEIRKLLDQMEKKPK
ncbi:MAG: BlaI/MecI/CopY family transcriptional regulator [Verrucomicrobia bacterium]|nr:BlaI/MecI/CopY family transcriptional regulator [Verrucomicrobiota bacterium]